MAKRKIIRKSNRPFTYNPHYYSWGGDFKNALGGTKPFDLKGTFSGGNAAGMLKGGLASGIGSAVGNIAGGAISGGLESGAGSAISNIGGTIGSAVSAVNPVLGGIISAGSGIIGGLTNRMFGSKLNEEKIAEVEGSNKAINTVMVDSSSADSVMDQWATQDFGEDFTKSDIGKDGWFSNKAKNKYKELKKQQDIARNRALTAFDSAADSIDTSTDLNALANFAADGGPLIMRYTGLMSPFGNRFAKGGKIHIKKANRGKFTKYCGGKVTSECIAKGKRSSNPAVRKRATFAANARKWKHEDGGPLNPYSAESLVDAIYSTSKGEQFLGKPSHNYDFTISEEEANRLGYYPDKRGHRDDRVKKPTHPTHTSRGKWNSFEEFELTDKGMENPNYTLFGLNDGGQDPQAIMTYKGGIVLPEITITPKESYIMNPYDNIKIFDKGGSLINKNSSSRKFNNSYKEGEIYDVTEEEVKILKELGYEFEYV